MTDESTIREQAIREAAEWLERGGYIREETAADMLEELCPPPKPPSVGEVLGGIPVNGRSDTTSIFDVTADIQLMLLRRHDLYDTAAWLEALAAAFAYEQSHPPAPAPAPEADGDAVVELVDRLGAALTAFEAIDLIAYRSHADALHDLIRGLFAPVRKALAAVQKAGR